MVRLVVIILFGALAWMCWWAFGQIAYERALTAWVEDRRTDGWAADISGLETKGFPNRFDTTVTDVSLADPETGIAWSAPFVQFLSLAYKPHQVIAVLPGEHRFSTPLQTMTISHDDARASLFLQPNTKLGLDRAVLVISNMGIRSSARWETALNEGRFALEAVPAAENVYRLGVEVLGLVPTDEARALLDPGEILPREVESLRADAEIGFTAPWDRQAIEVARPQVTNIDIRELSARWGEITFRAAGEVTVDGNGYPEGRITVRAMEWRRMLDMAEAVGWLPGSLRGSLEAALSLLSGEGDVLDAPLEFSGGRVSLGLIPLGDAPRIVIR